MFLISEEPGQSLLEPMRERERSKRQSNRTVKFIQPSIVVDAQQENDTTTEDPLEKLLRSINVFPVEDAIAKVNKTESSRIGRSLKAISLGKHFCQYALWRTNGSLIRVNQRYPWNEISR